MPEYRRPPIPETTVARLPVYLRSLLKLVEGDATTISSERLGELAGVHPANVRKDLLYLGSRGTRGVGYDVGRLLEETSRHLGLTREWPVVIVGVGHLGRALANYEGFAGQGFRVHDLFDVDPAKVGHRVAGAVVRHLDELRDASRAIGIIATPARAAQDVADRLVAARVSAIMNFAPILLAVPSDVSLRTLDLSVQLQILTCNHRLDAEGARP